MTLEHFGVKAARNLEQRVFAVREDVFDSGMGEAGGMPMRALVPFGFKTKTTKTP